MLELLFNKLWLSGWQWHFNSTPTDLCVALLLVTESTVYFFLVLQFLLIKCFSEKFLNWQLVDCELVFIKKLLLAPTMFELTERYRVGGVDEMALVVVIW